LSELIPFVRRSGLFGVNAFQDLDDKCTQEAHEARLSFYDKPPSRKSDDVCSMSSVGFESGGRSIQWSLYRYTEVGEF
jgi:hypothetical protein